MNTNSCRKIEPAQLLCHMCSSTSLRAHVLWTVGKLSENLVVHWLHRPSLLSLEFRSLIGCNFFGMLLGQKNIIFNTILTILISSTTFGPSMMKICTTFCSLVLLLVTSVLTSRGASLHWQINWSSQENLVGGSYLSKQLIPRIMKLDAIMKQRLTALDQEINKNLTILMTVSAVMSGIMLTVIHSC